MTRREVFDIRDMGAELDEEDQELMTMFPRSRECVLDDMVMVRRGERQYLERKSDIARRRKTARAVICGVIALVACVCLARAICTAVWGTGSSLTWLAGFEAIVIPALLRRAKAWKPL